MTSPSALSFSTFRLPTGGTAWIPADIRLQVPQETSIDPARLHYMIYIPWDDRYMELVDPAYRDFFREALPYLHVRTTDVHVATCLPFVKELLRLEPGLVDERVVHVAFILHDAGWSRMSEQEIAASLGVEGLALSGPALDPKRRQIGRAHV
jgi:hypothetical protein